MIEKFFKLSRKKQIWVCVFGLHAFIFFSLLVHHAATSSWKTKKQIAVRTYVVQKSAPPKKVVTPQKPPAAPPAVKPKPQSNLPAKKSPPTQPAKKGKEAPPAKAAVIDDLTAALDLLKEWDSPSNSRPALQVPTAVHIQQSQVASTNPSYGEFLVGYLESTLDLPEFGQVKIQLVVDREGHVISSEILSSENLKNSEFLKNRLPQLTFPCFNDFGITEKCLTFTVSFQNAENRY